MSEVKKHESQERDHEKTRKILLKLLHNAKLEIWDMRSELADSWDRSSETSQILQYLKIGEYARLLPPKTQSMAKMLTYLGLVESLGITFTDIALMLLIMNGKEMHTRLPFIKHVTSLRELQEVNLAYKQHFLKAYELDPFLELVNRKLRNKIAHLKFKIEENGTIKLYNNKIVDIDKVLEEFWKTFFEIIEIFDEIGFTNWLSKGKEDRYHE